MNDRIDDLIALAALGELDETEAAELDAAASRDTAVAESLAAALATAASLQAVTSEAPPVALRASVLDAIAAMPQEGASEPDASVADTAGDDGVVVPLDTRRRNRRLLSFAAAALLLVAGGAFVATSLGSDGDDPIAAVIESPDASIRTLVGSLDGSLEVAYSAAENATVLTGRNVVALADDETYQLWLVSQSGATSVGVFRPDDGGEVALRFDGVDPSEFAVKVTVEPAGGSDQPTLPVIAEA